jgi:hypothetical protein
MADGESGLALRAGVSDAAEHLLHGLDARFGRRPGKRVVPGSRAGPVPGVRIASVTTVAMVIAFGYGALVDESTKGPAMEGAVGGA